MTSEAPPENQSANLANQRPSRADDERHSHHASRDRSKPLFEENSIAQYPTSAKTPAPDWLDQRTTTLVEALNRHRGKGQQVVRVERVIVREGGQAIVGPVSNQGGGSPSQMKEQLHALEYAPGIEMPCSFEAERQTLPVAGNAEWPMQDARRDVAERAERE